MITLYHGSNTDIEKIELSLCSPDKDFGQGFYLTDIEEQALQMAKRRTRIAGTGAPVVLEYAFDESLLNGTVLNVKVFDKPCREWALFVMANREASQTGFRHEHDIVIGPVADDGVAYQLERYARGMITLETLVEELTYRNLNRQYFFGTELSISKLLRL
ncbi:DUF3990 domain-containing protein [Parabacteroides sp.]